MMKSVNRFWAQQKEGIGAVAVSMIMTLAIMTVRYMVYFS